MATFYLFVFLFISIFCYYYYLCIYCFVFWLCMYFIALTVSPVNVICLINKKKPLEGKSATSFEPVLRLFYLDYYIFKIMQCHRPIEKF